jgi:hypothetical protein
MQFPVTGALGQSDRRSIPDRSAHSSNRRCEDRRFTRGRSELVSIGGKTKIARLAA